MKGQSGTHVRRVCLLLSKSGTVSIAPRPLNYHQDNDVGKDLLVCYG